MRDFFEGIQSFFEDFAFQPLDYLRNMELESWWAANLINWVFVLIGIAAFAYWLNELKKFEDSDEENRSAPDSFLG